MPAETKTCSKCRAVKPYSEFFKAIKAETGRRSACKTCERAYSSKKWARIKADPEKLAAARKSVRGTYRKKVAENPENSRRQYATEEQYKARYAVNNAKTRGDLIPQPCVECGEPQTEAHHEDYSRPLDVIWLCRAHHLKRHRDQNNLNDRNPSGH